MRKKVLSMVMSATLLAAMFVGCGSDKNAGEGGKTEGSSSSSKVILITMDSTDQHWVSVDKGAKAKAEELGVEYAWMAPDKKDDAQQIERINNAIADGANAILIAANGPDSIIAALDEAKAEGIKIVYVDSPANTEAEATFATNNEAAGETAGNEMLKALEAAGVTSGKIGIVNSNAATDSTMKREKGFRKALEGKGFELLETQYSEGDAAKSQDIADNYITEGCVGVYGTNEGCTVGVGNAIKGAGGSVIGVGFDKSDAILSLIEEGSLVCTMAQNPDVMGEKGVEAAVKAIKGEEITEKNVDTGVSVINKDTVGNFK